MKKICFTLFITLCIATSILFFSLSNKNYTFADIKESIVCRLTLNKYTKIEEGMNYDEVKKIIGCDYDSKNEFSSDELETFLYGKSRYVIYKWNGKDKDSYLSVKMKNDRVIYKDEKGLK